MKKCISREKILWEKRCFCGNVILGENNFREKTILGERKMSGAKFEGKQVLKGKHDFTCLVSTLA